MLRCFPRKARQQWVFFLLAVCFVGVFLTYKRLLASEADKGNGIANKKIPHLGPNVEKLQQELMERVHNDMKVKKPLNADKLGDLSKEQHSLARESFPEVAAVAPPGRILENEEDYVTNDEKLARLKFLLLSLSPTNWKTTLDSDEMILLAKSELMDLGIESKLSCREIDMLKSSLSHRQGFFGKKIIDYAQKDKDSDYVLKSVGRDQQLKIECMKMDYHEDRCLLMGNYRLVKELVLFHVLNHPSIIRLEGFCLRGDTIDPRVAKKGAIIVTEDGNKIELELFKLLPWSTKLQVGIELLELLIYLENSPLGSMGFDKLQVQDFVLIGSDIKLVDLDNLQLDEYPCSSDKDCSIPEAPSKEIRCEEKKCKGRNSLRNLVMLHESVLSPLMKYSPERLRTEVAHLVEGIQQLRLSPAEVLKWFRQQQRTDQTGLDGPPADKPLKYRPDDSNNARPKDLWGEGVPRDLPGISGNRDSVVMSQNEVPAKKAEDHMFSRDQSYQKLGSDGVSRYGYERFANSNFPAMMTMVMKNSSNGNPDSNYGATLFKKKRRQPVVDRSAQGMNQAVNRSVPKIPPLSKTKRTSKPSKMLSYNMLKSCLGKVSNQTVGARLARERRLMTHLGLRGTTEDEWQTYAEGLGMVKYLGASQLASSSVKGGRFKFQFDSNAKELRKGEFIAELGPKYHHIGYLAAYHLDRILGLYHVPPTVQRNISITELQAMKGERFPISKYQNVSQDNIVHGIVTVPMPRVMKTEDLLIDKRTNLVTTVPHFTRQQKSQLEYILIWALTKMMQPQHGFLGYKGHLIHFEADLAFASLQKSLTGYFYNCQFPNTVYKTLVCYKCSDSRKMTTICGLGYEVIHHLRRDGFNSTDIRVGQLTADQMAEVIDNSATAVLQVVEQCIKTFSREEVLY